MDIFIKSLIWLLIVNIGSILTLLQNENIPNFLIMMADDLGYGDIGCYGNDTIKTPNIDRLASEGFVFTHHLAASSVCTPSRSAFLTGRYPVRSGMAETGKLRVLPFVASSGGLPDTEITFAKVLQELGYATALIGKWHLGVSCTTYNDNCHHPLRHGFDRFYGLPLTNLKDFGDDGAGVFMSNNPRIKAGLGWSIFVITISSLWFARYRSMPASDSSSCASNTELNRSIDTEITQSVVSTSKAPDNEDNNLTCSTTQKNVDGNSVANIACCSEKSRILKKVLTDTIYCHLLRWRSSPNSELNMMNNLPKNTGKTCHKSRHKSRSPPPPLWRPFCWCVCCMVLPLALFYTFITNIKILNSILMKDTHVVEQPINFANDLSQRLLDHSLQFLGEMAHRPDSNMNDVKGSENRVSKPQQPFLLFFSFLQVHTALHTGPRFHGVSKHGRFGDNVEEMDWMVGQLLDALDRFGFRNNTLIYFTSDQGGHIEEKGLDGQREGGYNGPFKGGKGQGGIEGGIRVPGILRYPPFTDTFYAKTSHNNKHPAPNSINIDIPTSLMDIWPTIVNLAQNAAPHITKNENSIKAKSNNLYAQQPNKIYKVWNYYDLAIKTTNNDTDPFWGGNEPKTIVIDGRDLAPLLNNYTMALLQENLGNSEIGPNSGTINGFSNKVNAFLKDGLGYLSSPAALYKQRRQDKNKNPDNITNHAKHVNNNHITFNHHEFLFHYCGTHIHAVRYMPKNESLIWKLYYATPKWLPGTQGCHYVCFCYGTRYINYHRPPLLYELTHDPFEDMPIKQPNISTTTTKYASTQHSQQNSNINFTDLQIQDSNIYHGNLSSRYHAIVETIERGMAIHKASIKPVVSQFSASNTVWKPWLQPCCNPPWCHCQEKAF